LGIKASLTIRIMVKPLVYGRMENEEKTNWESDID